MKYLFMFLVLTGLTIAQTTGRIIGDMTVWTDSIGYTNLSETSDSVWILDTKPYDWFRIFVEGNSNSPVDSFYIQAGTVRYSESKSAVDTIWSSWAMVRDSSWVGQQTMINNSVGKDWLLFNPVTKLLRFTLLNYRTSSPTRNVVITINAIKK